jgi:hypothetical protein
MASIIANNIIDSSSEIAYNYNETEEVFGYEITSTYSLNIADIAFENGDGFLIAGEAAVKEAYNKPNIVARIGGDQFLNGRITSANFESSPLVGSQNVTISIVESRRLDDYSSTNFCKYIPNPHLVESFTENYDFNRSDDSYSYNRDISLKYKQDAGDRFLKDAKVFLTQYYFANRPNFGIQSDGISEDGRFDKNYRGLLSENYDLIGLSVSLKESFNSSFIDAANKISRKETQNSSVDEKGFLKKTFSFELSSLRMDSENILQAALKTVIAEVVAANSSQFGDPSSIEKGIKRDGNSASLTIRFSTNPKDRQGDSVTYSANKQKAEKFTEYQLSAEYKGEGKTDRLKFKAAKDLWISHKGANITKIESLFSDTGALYEKSRNSNFNKTEGNIDESITFTTDPSYAYQDDGLLKFQVTTNKNKKIKRHQVVFDLADKKDKLVVSDLDSVGSATVTASTTIDPNRDLYGGKDRLIDRTDELQAYVTGSKVFMTSDSISLNLAQGSCSRTINYLYI